MILLQAAGTGTSTLIMFGMIFLVMYFFMIRPQINRQRAEQEFQKELKKGDKVTTVGGIYGKVTGIKESKIILEISENTKITIERNSISREKSIQNV